MKKFILSFLSLMPVLVSAQDVLYKTDNTKVEVKVTEVTETTIKYKAFSNPDGPLYTISKNTVAMIVYQNGQHEVIKAPAQVTNMPIYFSQVYRDSLALNKKLKKYNHVTQNKNVLFFNTVELLNSGIGISYLHEFGDGKFDLHVPFASSFGRPELDNGLTSLGSGSHGSAIKQTIYDIGLGVYFNTGGKRAVTHFIGPLIRNAQYSGSCMYGVYNDPYSTYGTVNYKMNETSVMLNNGFLYRITPRFNMMINFAVGSFVKREFVVESTPYDAKIFKPTRDLALHAGFHFGYRF